MRLIYARTSEVKQKVSFRDKAHEQASASTIKTGRILGCLGPRLPEESSRIERQIIKSLAVVSMEGLVGITPGDHKVCVDITGADAVSVR